MGIDEMTEEEARDVLRRSPVSGEVPVVPVVVDHPWWTSLRIPLTIMAIAFLINSVAVTSLTLLQVNDTNNSERIGDTRACRDAYTAIVAVAASGTRSAVADGQVAFNQGLLELLAGTPATEIDSTALVEAIRRIATSSANELRAVGQRDTWESSGAPLPCPLFTDDG